MESTKELQEGEAWVDEVVGHRRKRKCMQFRIKWVNDPKPTWEPFENVQSADAHIDQYVERSRDPSLIKWLANVGYLVKVKPTKPRQISPTYSKRRKRFASCAPQRAKAEKRQDLHPSSISHCATNQGPGVKNDITEVMEVLRDDGGNLQVLLQFKDGTTREVSNETAKQVSPGALFEYYEGHLVFADIARQQAEVEAPA